MENVVKKLFTKEDPQHIHKVLGVLALASFYYRYAVVKASDRGLGFTQQHWINNLTILVHLALSFSSIIFHVLRHRILAKPLIIYEE